MSLPGFLLECKLVQWESTINLFAITFNCNIVFNQIYIRMGISIDVLVLVPI